MSAVASPPLEILMVEGDTTDALAAIDALRVAKVGSHSTVVGTRGDAIAYLRHQGRFESARRPDLVLLDLDLERRDGRELLREMKTDPELMGIPVVVRTAPRSGVTSPRRSGIPVNRSRPLPESDPLLSVVETLDGFWLTVTLLPPGP